MLSPIACECLGSPCRLQASPAMDNHSNSSSMLVRSSTSAATTKAAPGLFDQLDKALKGAEGAELVAKTKVGVHAWVTGDTAGNRRNQQLQHEPCGPLHSANLSKTQLLCCLPPRPLPHPHTGPGGVCHR
jgi:hypothetical protein